jgi:hypothetical protein
MLECITTITRMGPVMVRARMIGPFAVHRSVALPGADPLALYHGWTLTHWPTGGACCRTYWLPEALAIATELQRWPVDWSRTQRALYRPLMPAILELIINRFPGSVIASER